MKFSQRSISLLFVFGFIISVLPEVKAESRKIIDLLDRKSDTALSIDLSEQVLPGNPDNPYVIQLNIKGNAFDYYRISYGLTPQIFMLDSKGQLISNPKLKILAEGRFGIFGTETVSLDFTTHQDFPIW